MSVMCLPWALGRSSSPFPFHCWPVIPVPINNINVSNVLVYGPWAGGGEHSRSLGYIRRYNTLRYTLRYIGRYTTLRYTLWYTRVYAPWGTPGGIPVYMPPYLPERDTWCTRPPYLHTQGGIYTLGGSREPLNGGYSRSGRLSGASFDVFFRSGRLSGASYHRYSRSGRFSGASLSVFPALGGSREPLF